MTIYIVTLGLTLFLWPVLNQAKKINAKKVYVGIICLWLIFLFAARNYTVGADTFRYYDRFIILGETPWANLYTVSERMTFEYGFSILNKLLYYISKDPRVYMVALNTLQIIIVCWFVYRYSEKPWLSFLIFICVGWLSGMLNVFRQYVAVVLVLVAVSMIHKKKPVSFVMMVLLASAIHTSALVALPMYWVSKIKFNWGKVLLFLAGSAGVGYFGGTLLNLVLSGTRYSRFIDNAEESDGALGSIVIYLIFTLIIVLFLMKTEDENKNIYIAFALESFALILLTFSVKIANRASIFPAMVYMVAVPHALSYNKDKQDVVYYHVLLLILLLFYYFVIVCRADVASVIPYEFWNGTYS